ncbi:hypothetical protein [Sulfuricurvum sp.]|uniref:hypothetical protein n=1 Tax=Sulfuricurvum sp. TaxID=2025608 RepID=UPI00262395D3|nr:hypothetical protein [Sulfuricurvum sp.]MDD4950822.1 hypothetical protein [Sulfuricurvum sp.]
MKPNSSNNAGRKKNAESFIATIIDADTSHQNNLKWIIRKTKEFDFETVITLFREIENYHCKKEFGKSFSRHTMNMPLLSGLFGGYMIEKTIVYAAGNKRVFLDYELYQTWDGISINDIYNRYNSFSAARETSVLEPIATMMLSISSEQMRIQRNPMPDMRRFYLTFGNDSKSNTAFTMEYGVGLPVMLHLSFILYIYVFGIGDGNTGIKSYFTKDEFVNKINSKSGISSKDIDQFFNSISIDREEYVKEYLNRRTNKNGTYYPYEEMELFDRAIPKVSYSYPLLRYKGGYFLPSLQSLQEFLKMDTFYRMLSNAGNNAKGLIVGPAIERYARMLMNEYKQTIPDENPDVYGDEEYYYNGKKHAPDAILETDSYLLFVECKANPFNLGLLRDFDEETFEKLVKSVEISTENINRYISLNSDRFGDKRVYKMLVYYEGLPDWYEMLNREVGFASNKNDLILADFNVLELLMQQSDKRLPDIIDSFMAVKIEKPEHTNFEKYLHEIDLSHKTPQIGKGFIYEIAERFGIVKETLLDS